MMLYQATTSGLVRKAKRDGEVMVYLCLRIRLKALDSLYYSFPILAWILADDSCFRVGRNPSQQLARRAAEGHGCCALHGCVLLALCLRILFAK